MMFSFKRFKPHSFLLVPSLFWKICCPHFQHLPPEHYPCSKQQRQGEQSQWLQRAVPSFGNMCSLHGTWGWRQRKSYNYSRPNFASPRETVIPTAKKGKEHSFIVTVDAAGTLDIHGGEKRHQCGEPDKHDEWQRRLPEISQQQSKANPLCRAQECPNQSGNLHRPRARENWVTAPHEIWLPTR